MSSTLVYGRSSMLSTMSTDRSIVCLFSLLGLTFSAAVLSYVSPETAGVMFSSIGW